jgi:hypothetical protein
VVASNNSFELNHFLLSLSLSGSLSLSLSLSHTHTHTHTHTKALNGCVVRIEYQLHDNVLKMASILLAHKNSHASKASGVTRALKSLIIYY